VFSLASSTPRRRSRCLTSATDIMHSRDVSTRATHMNTNTVQIASLFAFESLVKLIAIGFPAFFYDPWRVMELGVTVCCLADVLDDDLPLEMFKSVRALRLLRLVGMLGQFEKVRSHVHCFACVCALCLLMKASTPFFCAYVHVFGFCFVCICRCDWFAS
jgi:hypothetical protein